MTTIRAADGPAGAAAHYLLAIMAAALIAALTLAAPQPATADHGAGQDTIHKQVVAVNGVPVTDPDDPSDPISVTQGDTVTYRITITAGAEGANAAATVEDNFNVSQQAYVSATGGDCSLSEEGDGTKLTCEVTLNAQGDAGIDATFTMVAEAPEGEGCPTVQNVATVKTDAFEPRPSNQTQVEVCAADDAALAATATAQPPAPAPSPAQGGGTLPDTSTNPDAGRGALLCLLLLAVVAAAGTWSWRLRRHGN